MKMKYDLEKRIFLLEKYIKFDSITAVQRAYTSKYKNEKLQIILLYEILFLCSKKLVRSILCLPSLRSRVKSDWTPKIS